MKRALGACLVALAMAGCGSTVQVPGTGVPGGQDGLGSPATTGDVGGTAGGGPVLPGGGSTTGTGPGGASGGTAGAIGTTGSTAPRAPRSPVLATGVPLAAGRQPIRIGIISSPGLDKAAAAIGVNGLTTGDTEAQAEAVIGWIRAHGGLGGHPIKTFTFEMDLQRAANNPDAEYERACVAMKQDFKVRYVVTILNLRPGSLPCFAKGGIGVLDDQTGVNAGVMAKYSSYLANPGEFETGRMLGVLVDDLWKRGWLTATSTVGSFAYDSADGHAFVDGVLTSALARYGLRIKAKQFVSNGSGSINEASGAALKFRSEGVDRVIPAGASPLFLMNAASSQGYRPWYAMYSSFGPGALLEGTAPKDQLANSAGIGWQPFLDIGAGTKPGPVSSRETLCFDIMAKAGQATTAPTTKGFQAQVCNVLFYLKDIADRQPSIPADLLASSRPLIGSSFVSADTFRTDVTRRTDGVAGYRSLAYREDCGCYQYVSPVRPTP